MNAKRIIDIACLICIMLALGAMTLYVLSGGRASAAEQVPQVVSIMKQDILQDQAYVKEHDIKVKAAKEAVINRREFICKNHPEYCNADFLNPLGENVDLSRYLNKSF